MASVCGKCGAHLADNEAPFDVLQKLRTYKANKLDEKFPMLVAEFYCKNLNNNSCDFSTQVKWNDVNNDINVLSCPKCGSPLLASVFLGIVCGFHLESFCFSCLAKKNGGYVGYQK